MKENIRAVSSGTIFELPREKKQEKRKEGGDEGGGKECDGIFFRDLQQVKKKNAGTMLSLNLLPAFFWIGRCGRLGFDLGPLGLHLRAGGLFPEFQAWPPARRRPEQQLNFWHERTPVRFPEIFAFWPGKDLQKSCADSPNFDNFSRR